MVDLVKIRKKKAEEKKSEAAAAPAAETAPPQTPAPQAEPETPDAQRPAAEAAAAPPATSNQQPATSSKLDQFKQAAGKRRESGQTQALEQTTEDNLELLTFVMAGEQYAVDIERIVEIVTPRAATRIPNADASVVGIISLRGTIVTLVDVRRKLRHGLAPQGSDDTRVVVIDFQREIVGFVVDRVLRVVKVAAGEIEPHPVVHATELDDSIRGVFRVGGALTILLDLDKLLDHSALAARSA